MIYLKVIKQHCEMRGTDIMRKYPELSKKYDDVRSYMRRFYVYGFEKNENIMRKVYAAMMMNGVV